MFQRHHLPIHLVGRVDRSLTTGLSRIVLHFFVDIGHFVQGDDASTQEDRLHHHHRPCEEMARIRVEGIDQTLSDTIQLVAKLLHLCIAEVLQVFQFQSHCAQHHTDILHGQTTGYPSKISLHTTHGRITQVWQCRLLLVVEQ